MDLILTQIIEKVTDMYNEEVTNYTNDLGGYFRVYFKNSGRIG